jgi:hypothetical protein
MSLQMLYSFFSARDRTQGLPHISKLSILELSLVLALDLMLIKLNENTLLSYYFIWNKGNVISEKMSEKVNDKSWTVS